jgi:hypothetical protein
MDILFVALRDALSLTLKLLLIILPLAIGYEFVKHKAKALEKRKLAVLGISQTGFLPLFTGIIIGLTYGAGIIIHSIRTSDIGKKEAFLILLFLSVCHAIIEDTLIFVVIGAKGLVIVAFRFVLAIVLTFLIYRMKAFKR